MRLFLMPGVAHCMGGDGNDQVDWLTPLMSWVELKRAPEKIIAGKSAERAAPMMGGGGAPQARLPYSKPAPALASKRPIYPYPMIAKYTGNGDPNDAANYLPAKSPVKLPQSFGADIMRLIAPDNQKNYVVRDGKLLVVFSP
jgi:feruloyl esterase